jgi:hypothetical protein
MMTIGYRAIACVVLAIVVGSCTAGAFPQNAESPADHFFFDQEPPHGALIFQQRQGLEAEALSLATGSRYTHVGIIRNTGGGPYVMLSSKATNGVEEIPLDEFISLGVEQKFAIYVTKEDLRPRGQMNHPASLAAYDYYLSPYDYFYALDSEAIYNAELIFKIFQGIGHPIGHLQRIGDLNFSNRTGRELLLRNWRQNVSCRERQISRSTCWELIQKQLIITPRSLSEDESLKLFLTTF